MCSPDWFPPSDFDFGVCPVGDLSSEAIPPPVCDPRTCDFAYDDLPPTPHTDPWGNPIGPVSGVQLVPSECLFAGGDTNNEFLERCFGVSDPHDAFALPEALIRRFGSLSDEACARLPGSIVECQHGTYCEQTGGEMNPCVVCEGDAGCYRTWVRNDGLESTSPPVYVPVIPKCTFPNDCSPPPPTLPVTLTVVAPEDPPPPPPNLQPVSPQSDPPDPTERRNCMADLSCAIHMRMATEWINNPIAAATKPGPKVQDPVDVGSGQLLDSYVDLEAPGRHGLDGLHFRFERFYSSGAISQGVLGRNWWHSYEERIVPVDEYFLDAASLPGYCTAALPVVRCAAREVTVGRYEIYVQDPQTLLFEPPPGGDQILMHVPAPADGVTTWQMRSSDGTVKGFDVRGRLRWIQDRRRDEMHFVYGDDGRLRSAIDPFQREYQFEYADDNGVIPPDAQYGMLTRVSDFAGREVRYTYDTVTLDPGGIVQQSRLFDRGLPGLLPRHHRLTTVDLRGPAGESEFWLYGYLSYADAMWGVGEPPPLGITDPASEVCGRVESGLAARIAWELQMSHLLGNLTTIRDPMLRPVLDTTYNTWHDAPNFDRVIAQTFGDGVGDRSTEAKFLYFDTTDGVPSRVLDASPFGPATSVHPDACAEAAQRHLGHLLFSGPGPDGPPGLAVGGSAAIDAASVCAFRAVIDRRGVATWYGINYMGQPVVEAVRAGFEWTTTTRFYDPVGHLTMIRFPSGRTITYSIDAYAPNPLSRNNLLEERESAGPAGIDGRPPYRVRSWSYEPLFNQVIVATDVRGGETVFTYDFQELSSSDADELLHQLQLWGMPSSTLMTRYAPRLVFEGDANGDGVVGQVRGDLVKVTYPETQLASGGTQQAIETFRYNQFSQLVRHDASGREPELFSYFPTVMPTGASVARADAYLPPSLRAASTVTGGLERSVATTLVQDVAGVSLGGLTQTPVVRSTEYDLVGRPVRQVEIDGTVEQREIDGLDRVVHTIDGAGYETRYQHDPVGRVTLIVEGIDVGSVSLHGGRPARRTLLAWSAGGHLLGQCVERTEGACGDGSLAAMVGARSGTSAAEVITHRYDAEGNRVATIDGEGHESATEFDERGQPFHTTVGDGVESQYFNYDEAGRMEARYNDLFEYTTYRYDGFDRLVAVTDPAGTTRRVHLGEGDEQLGGEVVDASGTVLESFRQEYDQRGRVFEIARGWWEPAGQLAQPGPDAEVVTSFELDFDGRPIAITDPLGEVARRDYNSLGELEAATTPGGDRVVSYRDLSDRRIRARAQGTGTDLRRDTLLDGRGRVIETQAIDAATGTILRDRVELDALGNVVERTDAQGNVRTWTYDLAGRLTESREPSREGGAADRITTYQHDRIGHLKRMIDAEGVVTEQKWNAAGHLAIEMAGRQRSEFFYDAAGRRRGVRFRDQAEQSITRVNGRIYQIDTWSPTVGGARRVFGSDGLGRPTFAISYGYAEGVYRVHATRRIYDSLGRVVEEGSQLYPDNEHVVRSEWDAAGGLATLVYPDGSRVESGHDGDGHPVDLSWDGGAGHATFTWEGGTLVGEDIEHDGSWLLGSLTTRDPFGRVTGLSTDGTQGSLFTENRSLDAMGRVREQAQTWQGASRTRAFEYDGAGALSAVWSTPNAMSVLPVTSNVEVAADGRARWDGKPRSFDRDRTGTLLLERTGPVTHHEARSSSPDDHELREILAPSGVAVDHDTLGRVTTDGRSHLEWSSLGNLARATDLVTSARTDYIYDAFGRRVAKIADGVTDAQIWFGWNRIAVMRNGAVTRRTIFGPGWDHPIEVEVEGVAYFPIRDLQGSVVAAADGAGAIVESYQYDAYGNLTVLDADGNVTCEDAPPAACQPIVEHGYTGQLRDAETGLYYFKNRYYSPALRSFLSPDPLGYVDGPDVWQYVAGDPINSVDPAGTETMAAETPEQSWLEELGVSRDHVATLRGGLQKAGDLNDAPGIAIAPFATALPKSTFGDVSNVLSGVGILLGVGNLVTARTDDERFEAGLDIATSGIGLIPVVGAPASAAITIGRRLVKRHFDKVNREIEVHFKNEKLKIEAKWDVLIARQEIEMGRLDLYLKTHEVGQQAVEIARKAVPAPKGLQPNAQGGSHPRSSMRR